MEIKCKIEICLFLEEVQKFCTQLKKKQPRIKNKSWSWRFLSCTWQSETERQWESETERQWQANRKKKKGECQYETRPLPHPYSWAVTQMPPRRTWINLKLIGIPSVTWSTVCARYAKCNAQQGRKMKRESDTHTKPCTVLFIPMWKEIQLFKHLSNLFVLFKKWSCVCEIFINEAEEKILDERGKLSACLLHSDNQAVTDNSAMWTVQKKAPHCRFFSKI